MQQSSAKAEGTLSSTQQTLIKTLSTIKKDVDALKLESLNPVKLLFILVKDNSFMSWAFPERKSPLILRYIGILGLQFLPIWEFPEMMLVTGLKFREFLNKWAKKP